MTLTKRNIAANFIGNIWTALMYILFAPYYIRFMGIESYGLVGIFVTLLALFGLMDMGLSTTLNREMARLSVHPEKSHEMHDLLRTLEIIYWGIAIIISAVVALFAPLISQHWIQAVQLSSRTVQQAIMLMGVAIGLQWLISFYSGGLLGLQRQVVLNIIVVTMATLRGVGSIFVLWLVSPTILAFFSWQILISVLQAICVSAILWRSLPVRTSKARFNFELLRGIWRFVAGISGISVLALILAQIDKILLSKLLTLETFGYYTLASMVAMSLYRLIGPVFSGIYPRFTQLVAVEDNDGLNNLYHFSCQFLAVLLLSTAVILSFFSREILLLWTQDITIVEHTHLLLSIMVIGTALNGMWNMAYAMQLAHGWTSLAFYTNLVSVIILLPLIYVMTSIYGAIGAVITWVLLNSGFIFISVQLMHRRLLINEKWRWYIEDFGLPFVAAIITAGFWRWLIISSMPKTFLIVLLVGAGLTTIFSSFLVSSRIRKWTFTIIYRKLGSDEFRKFRKDYRQT